MYEIASVGRKRLRLRLLSLESRWGRGDMIDVSEVTDCINDYLLLLVLLKRKKKREHSDDQAIGLKQAI